MEKESIILKKVRVHNLKEVNLTLVPGNLIVFTGVSGSGKSSLAFDTIYAEGQRRYIESLSHHARRFLSELPRPDAESITGISPTISIEQKASGHTPRSTVGTMSGIYDYLRVLYARVGTPYCPVSLEPVCAQSREKILARILMESRGTKAIFLAPYARSKKAEFKEDFMELMRKGFTRLRIDGKWAELSEIDRLDASAAHDVDLVIDRIQISSDNQARITESMNTALEWGKGFFHIYDPDKDRETSFSEHAYSAKSSLSYGPLRPHDFSFNHPEGMCPMCHGLGTTQEFNIDRIFEPEKSIAEDCCLIGSSYQTVRYGNIYSNLAKIYHFSVHTPWKKLSEPAKHVFLYGTEKKWTQMKFTHPETGEKSTEFVQWRGILFEARERFHKAQSERYRKKMSSLMTETTCPSCQGSRIKPYPSATLLGGKKIQEIVEMPLSTALEFFNAMFLTPLEKAIGDELLGEIKKRLQFLIQVGVQYLSLNRTSPTLSGGEAQRVRLAAQIGSGLVGAIYVLDEPSIGLHPIDHHKLINVLFHLRDQGNTVIVVEHDLDTMRAADSIVDVGPGAGKEGGKIVAQGSFQQVAKTATSLTGGYLSGRLQISIPLKRRVLKKGVIEILGASCHNLRGLNVEIPLGGLLCVTGVSGSGKSSLITDTLAPALLNELNGAERAIGAHREIRGISQVDKVIAVDQSPIGRTPRSNAATYIKLLDEIRDLFASLPESKVRLFGPGHFSFNVKEGACSYCNGLGSVRIDMDFLEEASLECPQCKGRRFNSDILAIEFKGKNIYDILNTDVESALSLFSAIPSIRRKLEVLKKVGLGYLCLGQPSTTLSGGEAQRIKLAKELVRPSTGQTFYILDEPTTGLHFEDVRRLIDVLQALVDKGNTVLVIEHNTDLIKTADWVIDLGPSAGTEGGELIGAGTPEQIAQLNTPTGAALKTALHPTFSFEKKSIRKKKKQVRTSIEVHQAEQNNLKKISLSIPHHAMSVFTGPSGAGKSSLAFETIYAEGQRRYLDTLSSHARQAIKQMPKPKVEAIEGLLPTIALEQKTGGLNPRSTIGTLTEVYDLFRILYSYLGTAYCPETNEPIRHISKETVLRRILELPEGEKIQILTPVFLRRQEPFEHLVERLNKEGYLRIRLNGIIYELDASIPFEKHRKNEMFLVIDRLIVKEEIHARLSESLEKAVSLSHGIALIAREGKEDLFFNLSFAVERTGKSYPPITPHTFSFNSESGMCIECQGLGQTYGAHLEDSSRFLDCTPLEVLQTIFQEKNNGSALSILKKIFKKISIDLRAPLRSLSPQAFSRFLHGASQEERGLHAKEGLTLQWIGLYPFFARAARCAKPAVRQALLPWLKASKCASCEGTRLNPLARNVRIDSLSLPELCALPIGKAHLFLESVQLPMDKQELLKETLEQSKKSLLFLLDIGLHYLSLDRSAPTLSGGELQRIRLARQLGSGLTSCLYVLDEPTIGLHPQNSRLLLSALQALRSLGNTLLIVEHDPQLIEAADYIVDFGPSAGEAGGKVIAKGSLEEIKRSSQSVTGVYLSGKKQIAIPKTRRPFEVGIKIENATLHNLKDISLTIPKRCLSCLTGVSGSGKSTLLSYLLKPAVEQFLRRSELKDPIEYKGTRFTGLSCFDKLITIEQTPIGQTNRADVTTYSEIQPLIRSHFAALPQARAKGLQPRHFSYNHLAGMCRTCWGLGWRSINLQFLPPAKVLCESCHGYRLNPVALEVFYRGKHMGQILKMSISEALDWFSAIPQISRKLRTLIDIGLEYLQLGQAIATLSGGEVGRLRLARELSKRSTGKTLYLIDEPSVGLHPIDVEKLLAVLHRLVDKKNTVVLIEHNLDVLANADWIFDLGPEAGSEGGFLVTEGTPEQVAKHPASHTGRYLKELLLRRDLNS